MTRGRLLYRCRLCGQTEESWGVPDLSIALSCIATDCPTPPKWGLTPKLQGVHFCGNGRLGITDLLGGVEERPAPGQED